MYAFESSFVATQIDFYKEEFNINALTTTKQLDIKKGQRIGVAIFFKSIEG